MLRQNFPLRNSYFSLNCFGHPNQEPQMAKSNGNAAPLRRKLQTIIGAKHGAQTKFAKRHRLSIGYVNNALHGRRPINEKLRKAIASY